MAALQVASVSSLETLAFKAVHPKEMLKFLADVWTSPIRQQYWSEFKQPEPYGNDAIVQNVAVGSPCCP